MLMFPVAIDVRQQKVLASAKAHSLNLKTICIDPMEDFIVTGSSEGDIKAYSLPSLECVCTWDDAHMKHTFVRKPGAVFTHPVSTYGVMQVQMSGHYVYSCGSDGRVLRTVPVSAADGGLNGNLQF